MRLVILGILLGLTKISYAEEQKYLGVENFKDGEVKLIKYKLPSNVANSPDVLTFKIFNLPFLSFKSDKEEKTYYSLLSSPLGVEKGDYQLDVMNGTEKIENLLVPVSNRTNLQTEEVLNTTEEIVLPKKAGVVEK